MGEIVTVDAGDDEAGATRQGDESDLANLGALKASTSNDALPAIRGAYDGTMQQWLHEVDSRVATYWHRVFDIAGIRYEPPRELIFTGEARSPCGKATLRHGPFYCPFNEVIYMPVDWFNLNSELGNDAAIAVVVAHESGHHVQHLLGIDRDGYRTIQLELQADCLAGNWASSLIRRDDLQAGDVGEFLTLLDDVADSPGVSPSTGTPTATRSFGRPRSSAASRNPEDGCPVPPVPSGGVTRSGAGRGDLLAQGPDASPAPSQRRLVLAPTPGEGEVDDLAVHPLGVAEGGRPPRAQEGEVVAVAVDERGGEARLLLGHRAQLELGGELRADQAPLVGEPAGDRGEEDDHVDPRDRPSRRPRRCSGWRPSDRRGRPARRR